jgi:hypothetical protein
MIRFVALSTAALILTGAAFAGTDVKLPPFSGITVHGGAHVILRHGTVQRVTVVKGDLGKADLHISGTTLDISPCKTWCWHVGEFEVEIISPKIDDVVAHSGGALQADGEFPKQASLHLTAHSGGAIEARAIPADAVNALAHSGGSIQLKALSSLEAMAHSGGSISYTGNPPHLSIQSHSGGSISKD